MEQGQRFGLLTVAAISEERRHGERVVVLQCDCGAQTTSVGSTLRAGKKLSCGCRKRGPHRKTFPLLWDTNWLQARYENDGLSMPAIAEELGCSIAAVHKGMRRAGIAARPFGTHFVIHGHAVEAGNSPTYRTWINMKVRTGNPNHDMFHHYGGRGITVCDRWKDSFANFLADMGERPEGMSIDRIDVDGNYEPSNCRWATQSEQIRNRRPRAI